LAETFIALRRIEREREIWSKMSGGIHVPKYLLIVFDFNETWIDSKDFFSFEKSSNNQFYENPTSGSRVVACSQTDRYDEANNRFSQFFFLPNKLIKSYN
jgi:hypothetical protein